MKNSSLFKAILLSIACVITVNAAEEKTEKQQSTHNFRYDVLVRVSTNATVGANEVAKGVLVLNGDAVINGKVEENAAIVKGNAEINGEVGKDIFSVLGSVKIGPKAKIGQNIILVGSKADISPSAEIGGSRIDMDFGKIFPGISSLLDWVRYGALRLRPFAPQVKATWVLAILSLVFNLILLLVFPKTINSCIDVIKQRPVTSFLIGLLVSCFIAPTIIALLALSVVGVFAIPIVICATIIILIFGKVATYRFIGHQVGSIRGSQISSPVWALVLGSVLIYLVYMLPLIGLIGWCAVSIIGLGAASVAAFNRIWKESPKAPPSAPLKYIEPAKDVSQTEGAQVNVVNTEENNAEMQQVSPQPTVSQQPPVISQPVDYTLMVRVGFWRRFVATLIDFCIFIIPFSVFHGAAWLLWIAYHFIMWALTGATVGDIVMKIKIVKEDGSQIDWKTSFIRIMAAMLSAVALFVGFFWAGWTREKQSWHDIIAGTIVVEVPKK
ncbi:MAG TPA: RDD family protein [Verrucomicrobiota bacterium]|nr:RDD family protein [Verrucomicrobiota bacterium]